MNTPEPRDPWLSDERLDLVMGRLLQAGVLIAAFVVAVGAIALIATHGRDPLTLPPVEKEPAVLRSVVAVVAGALRGNVDAVIQLGLLLLIATPVTRVAFTLVAFVIRRDRIFVVVTAIVLGILLYGVIV